jgi:hypothetical protein
VSKMSNLINNLLVIGILTGIFIILYCKIKNVTVGEMLNEIKEALFN